MLSAFLWQVFESDKLRLLVQVNWDHVEEGDSDCPRTRDQADAESVCRRLGIEFHVVNFVKEYWNLIFMELVSGYQNGQTLVPDIECNRLIKFGLLHEYVQKELKIDAIATGHYAQNSWGNYLEHSSNEKEPLLLTANDSYKDQTFFLSTLNSDQLKRSMFPIGALMKPDVKGIAAEHGFLDLAQKRESMGICFVGKKKNFPDFLEKYVKQKPGPIVEASSGRVIGEHKGTHNYTLGKRVLVDQRIYPNHNGLFVLRSDYINNVLYVCEGSHNRLLYARAIKVGPIHWISQAPPSKNLKLSFRTQRTHSVVECQFEPINETEAIVASKLPIRATAPGQSCVFYDGNVCLGSARIIDVMETL